MARNHPLAAFALLAALTTAAAVQAQDRGALTGRVIDKKTGHAIPFGNIAVVEAKRGGLTDSEGRFLITGLAPGTYEVRVQLLGYRPESKPGVVVSAGATVTLDFALTDVVVKQEKVVETTADRPLVQTRLGTTIRSVGAAEIRNLPVQTIGDVLKQQAGISTDAEQMHVRGGRANETIFVINGVVNRDLVTGGSTAGQVSARSVSEVSVATGAFDVRYGNALSGVVDVRLKEGGDRFACAPPDGQILDRLFLQFQLPCFSPASHRGFLRSHPLLLLFPRVMLASNSFKGTPWAARDS